MLHERWELIVHDTEGRLVARNTYADKAVAENEISQHYRNGRKYSLKRIEVSDLPGPALKTDEALAAIEARYNFTDFQLVIVMGNSYPVIMRVHDCHKDYAVVAQAKGPTVAHAAEQLLREIPRKIVGRTEIEQELCAKFPWYEQRLKWAILASKTSPTPSLNGERIPNPRIPMRWVTLAFWFLGMFRRA